MVPLPVPVLLTRERVVPAMLLGREAVVIVDLTVPEGGGGLNEGMGDRERKPVDFVELIVPAFFASAAEGGGLSSLLGWDTEVFLAFGAELEALGAAGTASALAFSPFLSAGPACAALGTGMLDGAGLAEAGAGAAGATFALLLLPPMFHTLRTSDLAAPKNPNLDFAFAASPNDRSALTQQTKSTTSGTYLAAPQRSAVPGCSCAAPSPRPAPA